MKIILLGTGGYFPNRIRQTACMMIPEVGVVLDAGTAACEIEEHLVTDELDIFLSHAHLDHVFGLTCLLTMSEKKPKNKIRVHAEKPKLDTIRQHLFSELLFPVSPPFQLVELATPVPLSGGGTLTSFPLQHPGGSLGFRLEWPGHSLAYVTDTKAGEDQAYLEQIQGVDLLIHEAYFNDGEDAMAELTGHSCVTDVAQAAATASVGRLVLVHMNPMRPEENPLDLDNARKVFPNIQVGQDGMELEF